MKKQTDFYTKNWIIFDLDGTLIDSMPAHIKAYQQSFEELGIQWSEPWATHYLTQGIDYLMNYQGIHDPVIRQQIKSLKQKYFEWDLVSLNRQPLQLMMDTACRCAIITNARRAFVDQVAKKFKLPINWACETIIARDSREGLSPKPHYSMGQMFMDQVGIVSQVSYIGDNDQDETFATSMGWSYYHWQQIPRGLYEHTKQAK